MQKDSGKFEDPMLTVDEAYQAFQNPNTVFVDVRDPTAYQESHIPGARNMNEVFTFLGTSDQAGREEMKNYFERVLKKAGINGDEHLILYEDCLKTRFGVSCRGYFILKLIGFNNVSVLNGGWCAWKARNYPTDVEIKKQEEGTFKANWNDTLYAGKEDIIQALNHKDAILVDVRDDVEWTGSSSSPYGVDFVPRKGRFEGAIHLMWRNLITTDEEGFSKFKTDEEILKICEEKSISRDKPIIIYCFKGSRASNTLIALKKAGFKDVKNYFASWNEWSRDNSLPIDDVKF